MFLILTEAGKPVYSSKTNVNVPEISGILVTFYEFFLKENSKLLCMGNDRTKIVFLKRNSLLLIYVDTQSLKEEVIYNFLKEKSDLLVFYFTKNSLIRNLKEFPNTELKMVKSIQGKLQTRDLKNLFYVHECIEVLKVPFKIRDLISKIVSKYYKSKEILQTLLISNRKIVTSKRSDKFKVNTRDLLLLIENSSTSNQENVEIWMPVCFPRLNMNAFVWVYGVFLTPKLGLLSITTEKEGFFSCSKFAKDIFSALKGLKEMESLAQSIRADPLHLVEIGIPGLLHFIYKSKLYMQVFMPRNIAPYTYKEDWRRLIMKYQRLALKLKETRLNFLLEKDEKEMILSSQTPTYEIYIVLGPLTTLEAALEVQSRLLSWLKAEHDSLFLTCSCLF
jgi:hypothetical protein